MCTSPNGTSLERRGVNRSSRKAIHGGRGLVLGGSFRAAAHRFGTPPWLAAVDGALLVAGLEGYVRTDRGVHPLHGEAGAGCGSVGFQWLLARGHGFSLLIRTHRGYERESFVHMLHAAYALRECKIRL